MTTSSYTGYLGTLSAYTAATATAPASYTETTGTGYARSAAVTLTYDPVANTLFIPSGLTEAYTGGTISASAYIAVFDAASGGNLLMVIPVTSVTPASGASFTWPAQSVAMVANVFATTVSAGTVIGTCGGNNVTAGVSLAGGLVAGNAAQRVTLTYAATVTPNAALGNHFYIVLTGNVTLNVPTNAVPGRYVVEIVQDGTGSRTFTKGAGMLIAGGAPTATTTAAAIDRLDLEYDGSNWTGIYSKAFA